MVTEICFSRNISYSHKLALLKINTVLLQLQSFLYMTEDNTEYTGLSMSYKNSEFLYAGHVFLEVLNDHQQH